MFNINPQIIANGCYKKASWQRGLNYYHSRAVESLQYYPKQSTFQGFVRGTRSYLVRIRFDKEKNLDEVYCSCPDFSNYPGYFCKHLVATLVTIEQNNFDPELWWSKQVAEDIFRRFEGLQETKQKQELNLEIIYNFAGSDMDLPSYLELKVGLDKLYVVKSVKTFLEAIHYERELEFGKKFVYEPARHIFNEQDQQLLEILWELYEVDKHVNEQSYYYKSFSFFSGKKVYLTDNQLKRFFKVLIGSTLKASFYGEKVQDVGIIEKDLPLNFMLFKNDDNIIIEEQISEQLIPLTKCGSYYYYAGHIHKLSQKQIEYFHPFYLSLKEKNMGELVIIPQYKEKFISEIVPNLKKVGEVNIAENLASEIEQFPLKAQLYLDMEDENLTGQLKFVYGDLEINPFNNKVSALSEKIILRDITQERSILTIFEDAQFKVKNGMIYLDDEEKIYDFVYTILPKLQNDLEIYYSTKLNRFKFIQKPNISGSVRLNNDTDMLEFTFDIEGIDKAEIYNILEAYKEKKKYYRLQDGSFISMENPELDEVQALISGLNLKKADLKKDILQIPKYRAMYFDQLLQDKKLKFLHKNKAFKELTKNIRDPEELEFCIPEELNNILRDYQKLGFYWLKTLYYYGFGGILADDMGLGKTLQAITFLLSEKKVDNKPALVVCPTSLVYNWQSEVQKFAPQLKTKIIAGTKEQREDLLTDLEQVDLVITSYPLLRRDIEEYLKHDFSFCLLDEAQYIKNHNSQTAKAAKLLKANNYFALTGTPLENSLTELWSIFDFVMPGFLPSFTTFVKKYLNPIEKEQDSKAIAELTRLVSPFILRRVKEDVLKELPAKIENKMVSELTTEQKKVYLSYRDKIVSELSSEIKEKGFDKSRLKVLAGLTRLRQICCHPGVFLENYQGESGKLNQLREVLQEVIEGGHRVLLFSQFTQMLSVIKEMLEKEGYNYLYLDGSVSSKDRIERVSAFNKGQGDIFLISLKAGGTGLNLTGADVVIHFDPWWNPAMEEQATDRAHRIGQKKVVQVMKFIARGTIEEKIYELQQKKKELIDQVIKPGEDVLSVLSEKDFYQLLGIDD
ncbi:MAG: hypothetical protein PWP71_543 [Clostridia bacterium]|jgi:SNF2 family DNA or RNA helicase/predicted nucleic acid-binding Zn finger protein|nr:hypothetical protein [Clostridia bacterium]